MVISKLLDLTIDKPRLAVTTFATVSEQTSAKAVPAVRVNRKRDFEQDGFKANTRTNR